MPWVRFDDRYPSNRKVGRLSDAAFRLDASAICWCSENTTDGRIASDELGLIPHIKRPKPAAAELVRAGRWHTPGHDCPRCPPIEDGWVIHDFLDYNPSAEKVQSDREAKADRQRRWLDKRRRATDTAKDESRDASQDPPIDRSRDGSKDDAPSRPVPSRPEGTNSSLDRHPQPQTREAPDEDDDLDKITAKIEGRIVEVLRETTGRTVDRAWASKVRKQLLDDREVRDPLRYIAAAIRGEPQKYLPTAAPMEAGNQVLAHLRTVDRDETTAATERGAPAVRDALAAAKARKASAP